MPIQNSVHCFLIFWIWAQSLLSVFLKVRLLRRFMVVMILLNVKSPFFRKLPVEYPVCWLEIQPAYPKYAEKLGHRDFLGSILGLGLERSCIGDLLIENSTARILCLERVQDFIISGTDTSTAHECSGKGYWNSGVCCPSKVWNDSRDGQFASSGCSHQFGFSSVPVPILWIDWKRTGLY